MSSSNLGSQTRNRAAVHPLLMPLSVPHDIGGDLVLVHDPADGRTIDPADHSVVI